MKNTTHFKSENLPLPLEANAESSRGGRNLWDIKALDKQTASHKGKRVFLIAVRRAKA